jgi:hypothetical protein
MAGGGIVVQGGRALITKGGFAAASQEVAKKVGKEYFRDGELFEWTIETSKGKVGMLAETSIKGRSLSLDNIAVFARDSKQALTGLSRETHAARTQLTNMAREQGFKSISLSYVRSAASTSAKPGKKFSIKIDLNK